MRTHKNSQDKINYGNDDKIVDVENIVKSENATENNVEVKTIKANNTEPEDAKIF